MTILNTHLPVDLASGYSSNTQRARVMSEGWVEAEGYCPACGSGLVKYENNRPVADFKCPSCTEDFELKARQKRVSLNFKDGTYRTMIERLNGDSNPNFFLMSYNPVAGSVLDFLVIPKHFITPACVIEKPPLKPGARRAGWVGCNLVFKEIPRSGMIYYVSNGMVKSPRLVQEDWKRTLFVRQLKEPESKGWILEIMKCIDLLPGRSFTLADMYAFETRLQSRFPKNRFVRDKIRQQLQVLRDRGYIEFQGRGKYKIMESP